MHFDRFLPDYGILPSAYFQRSAISNPIELFWSDDVLALLRLCGEKEENIGERASDFDKFQAILRALPLLEGHPTRVWIESLVGEYFDLKELPTAEKAHEIWKTLCVCLLENPISPQKLVRGAWLCDALTVPNDLPKNVTLVLDANLLLQTNATTTALWSLEIAKTVASFVACGCQKIVLHLPNDFVFLTPSVYHVDKALQSAKRSREAENLLRSQLMRELCTAAQEHDLLLVLICQNNAIDADKLLNYCETSVGLPRICWSAREAREAHVLLAFTAKPHKNEILVALPYEIVMTKAELSSVIESWQVRYPTGKLCFLTVCDLRQTPYAQASLETMLNKSETKI